MNAVRWEALGAVLAGMAWLASFTVSPEVLGSPSYVVEGTFGAALLGTLVGLVALHTRQSRSYGALGLAGFLAAAAGTALVLLNVLLISLDIRDLLDLLLGLGFLGMLVGFVVLGVATIRGQVLPGWCGVALIVALPVAAALGNYGGGMVLGLLWLALGYALWSGRVGSFR
ncbi:hypothetical protein BH24ACT19_BH24ACT19_14420 [soil metagenome]